MTSTEVKHAMQQQKPVIYTASSTPASVSISTIGRASCPSPFWTRTVTLL